MAVYQQFPGELDVVATHGDGITIAGSLGFNTTGDTLTAVVYEDSQPGYLAAIDATPAPAATWTITRVNNATGDVTLALSAATTKSLTYGKAYRWFMRSVTLDRAAVSGRFLLRAP